MANSERAAKTRTGIYLYRVEGGISGSMHHRGPSWYATRAEAEAACEGDRYPSLHPACVSSDIGLDWREVKLPTWVLPALRKLAPADRGEPYSAPRGKQIRVLASMALVRHFAPEELRATDPARAEHWCNHLRVTELAEKLLAANPEPRRDE